MTVRVAVLTYSTKPRGGVVHSMSLAEALQAQGVDVTLVGLGPEGSTFYRPTTVPVVLYPAIDDAGNLDEKVFASVDSMAAGLVDLVGEVDLLHSQDCISARAAVRVRDSGSGIPVLRTVHHIDDFTTEALIHCQRQAILEPDRLLVVSDQWREVIQRDYRRPADVVRNGVDPDRFPPIDDSLRQTLRASVGGKTRPVLLTVGGIEPRKGTRELFEAVGLMKHAGRDPVLVMLGGHSFQDYEAYRRATLDELPRFGLELGRDIVQLGTVDEDVLGSWFRAADVLAFPSTKEGFGLVVLEAMAADLPVVASDIDVFRGFLTDGENALLPLVGNARSIAAALTRVLDEAELRDHLVLGGRALVPEYTWPATAKNHLRIYQEMIAG